MTDPDDLLIVSLLVSVPLLIVELRRMPAEARRVTCASWTLASTIVVKFLGDLLQEPGSRTGQVAEVYNVLAHGLAASAFQPGGVTYLGHHWEVSD